MSTSPSGSNKNDKIATPFSLRLTFEERAALEQSAGNRPLGAYIRSKLFAGKEKPRKARTRTRKPLKDEKALGELLGKLGIPPCQQCKPARQGRQFRLPACHTGYRKGTSRCLR